jgi:hypothetical protein
MTDGVTTLSFATEDPKNFPASPEQENGETTLFSEDIIESIGLCRHYMADIESALSFCFIVPEKDKSVVFATDTAIFYLKSFTKQLPELSLTREVCSILASYRELEHYTSVNYDFFSSGRTVYGFIKNTCKWPPYKVVLARANSKEYFKSPVSTLSGFLETATSAAVGQVPFASLVDNGDSIMLKSSDPGYSIDVCMPVQVEKNYSPKEFSFNAKFFNKAIKNLPYDDLIFSPVEDAKGYAYYMKSESDADFVGLVMGFGK